MVHWLIVLLTLPLILSCSTSTLRNQSSTLPIEEAKADPEYLLAQAFDSILNGLASSETSMELLKGECQKNHTSSICWTFKKIKSLKQFRAQREKVHSPNLIKPMAPILALFSQGKISNWSTLRKSPIPNMLKGFLALSKEQLLLIAHKSQSEKRCPNNVAVAAAATLEDYLPDDIPFELLASLYAKGGTCKTTPPADREQFLTRSGLFYILHKDYPSAAASLSKVNPTDAYSGRATYWLYRVKKELGDKEGASKALRKLNNQHRFSFHNLVASYQEKLEPIPELSRSLSFTQRSTKTKAINADIQSAEVLIRLGFPESSHTVADWILNSTSLLEPEVRVYLSQLGNDHTKVSQIPAVLMFHPELLSRESIILNYPTGYLPLCERHRGNFSPYLLLAIARRESSFNPKAISPANAQGLLQMNPETVKQLYPEKSWDLLDAETNITIASNYLSRVLSEMAGNLPMTLAAYNAGEAPAHTWEKRYPTQDKILWIDLIPYRETRDYVANVLSSYHWYRKIYENRVDFTDLIN